MPTIHVNVSSEAHLQDIANAISKSKRIVVVTGAGISTNAGIPDFRSTGGLYSLIQAQYDATFNSSGARNDDDPSLCDPFDSWDAIDQRPTKRRRLSADDSTVEMRNKVQQVDAGTSCPALDDEDMLHDLARYKKEKSDSSDAERREPGPWIPSAVPISDLIYKEIATGPVGEDQAEKATCPEGAASRGSLCSTPARDDANSAKLSSEEESPLGSQRRFTSLSTDSPLSSAPSGLMETHGRFSLGDSTSPSLADSRPHSRSGSEAPSPASTPSFPGQSCSAMGRQSLKGKDMFDTQVWASSSKTEVFYKFQTSLRKISKTAEPTDTHRFLVALRDQKKLVRCYSQNIDLLEEKVGLSTALELGPGSRIRFTTRRAPGCGRGLGADEGVASESDQSSQQSDRANPEAVEEEHSVSIPAFEASLKTESPEKADSPVTAAASQEMSAADAATIRTGHAPRVRGVECVLLHGSLSELRCFHCGKTASWDEEGRELETLSGRQPLCPHCIGATKARRERGKRATGVGKLRPDIVLYGEENPRDHLIRPLLQEDLSANPDMLLIMGTSLRVHGLKFIVKDFARVVHNRGGHVVFVNKTKPADSVWGDVIDYWVGFDCDAWVGDLRQQKPVLWEPVTTGKQAAGRRRKAKQREATSSGAPVPFDGRHAGVAAMEPKEGIEASSSPEVNLGSPVVPPGPIRSPKRTRPAATKNRVRSKTAHDTTPTAHNARDRNRGDIKERKHNPNAKRPQAIRDHKMNGVHFVSKIRQDLARIVEELYPPLPAVAAPAISHENEPQRLAWTPAQMRDVSTTYNPGLPGHCPQTMPGPSQYSDFTAHGVPSYNFTAVTNGRHMPSQMDVFSASVVRDDKPYVLSDVPNPWSRQPPDLIARDLMSMCNGGASTSQTSREWGPGYQLHAEPQEAEAEAAEAAKALQALRCSH